MQAARLTTLTLALALATSLAANAAMLRRAIGRGGRDVAGGTSVAASAGRADASRDAPAASAASAANAPDAAEVHVNDCATRLAQARERLADAEASAFELLPVEQRFGRSAPNPDAEDALRPGLDAIFAAPENAGAAYTVECRGRTCRLQVLDHGGAETWMRRLQQSFDTVKHYCQASFLAGTPTNDQSSGEALVESDAYLTLCEPGMRGTAWLRALYVDFMTSKPLAACAALDPHAEGRLDVQLRLVGGQVQAQLEGPLAATALGRCAQARLAAFAAEHPAPPSHPDAAIHPWIDLPLPPAE